MTDAADHDTTGDPTASNPTYETVFWDIGGVIIELKSVREGYAAFIAELAADHDLDPDAALETWKSVLGDHFANRDGTEYRPAHHGYTKATAALFEDDPPPDWEATFNRATSATLRATDGAPETIQTLAAADIQQAIVSDIDTREAENMLDTFDIRHCFDHITTSEAVGYTKPDARMFRDALTATNATPADTLMVGDRHTHDIEGAAALGIATAGYGENAWGPETDHEIEDLRELPAIIGLTA